MLLHRISVLAAIILTFGSAVAVAKPNSNFPQTVAQNQTGQGRMERGKDRLMQQLGLNQQQIRDMEAIRAKYKDRMQTSQQNLRQASEEMRRMMSGTASSDQIRQQHQKVQALRNEVEDLRFSSMLEMREKLTTEQRAKLDQLMKKRGGNFRNRPGKSRDKLPQGVPSQAL